MKKFKFLIFALAVIMGVTSCSKDDDDDDNASVSGNRYETTYVKGIHPTLGTSKYPLDPLFPRPGTIDSPSPIPDQGAP